MLPRCIPRLLHSAKKSVWNVKFAHSDIQFPDFDKDRRDVTKRRDVPSQENAPIRKAASCLPAYVTGLGIMFAVKSHLVHYVQYMAASKDVLAVATAEVELSNIPEGKVLAIKWRGKPVFIYHRSQQTIDQERSMDISLLRDPETDEARVYKSEWLVVLGICTHLGCVPIPNSGMIPGGFYCPCHGSHYDAAGRIRKGPAPTNMEVPTYRFLDDQTILIG